MTTNRAKQNLQSAPIAPTSQEISFDSLHSHLVKGKSLQPMTVEDLGTKAPIERKFKSVKEIEEFLLRYAKFLFGQHIFVIRSQKKTAGLFGENTKPNFFLLDLSDIVKPRLYVVDIRLQASLETILLGTGRYLSRLRNEQVVETLIEMMASNKDVRKELLTKLKASDIQPFLKIPVVNSCVLLLMDQELQELPEVMGTLAGSSWQSVKPVLIKKYASNGNTVITMTPSFNELHYNGKQRKKNPPVTEEFHLGDVDASIKAIYQKIKSDLLKVNKQLVFNPKQYYISLKKDKNVAFFEFSRQKINLIIKKSEEETRNKIKHHFIRTLTPKVQKFWGGVACTIVIENENHLNEVTSLLKELVKG